MPDAVLDAKGLICPLPILRARKALVSLPAGALLRVQATDPSSARDFQTFCLHAGHDLVEWSEDRDGVFHYLIRKGG